MSSIYSLAKESLDILDGAHPVVFKWKLKVRRLDDGVDGQVVIDYRRHKAIIYIHSLLREEEVAEVVAHEWAHLMCPTENHGPVWGAAYGACYATLFD